MYFGERLKKKINLIPESQRLKYGKSDIEQVYRFVMRGLVEDNSNIPDDVYSRRRNLNYIIEMCNLWVPMNFKMGNLTWIGFESIPQRENQLFRVKGILNGKEGYCVEIEEDAKQKRGYITISIDENKDVEIEEQFIKSGMNYPVDILYENVKAENNKFWKSIDEVFPVLGKDDIFVDLTKYSKEEIEDIEDMRKKFKDPNHVQDVINKYNKTTGQK